jgi:cystathionine beta-lyase/cystathionine gamma-synthase
VTKPISPETIAAEAGGLVDEMTGSIIPPIHTATTYIRDPDNKYRRGFTYGRPDTPNVRQAESIVEELESAAACLMFGSGMAAATTAFLAPLPKLNSHRNVGMLIPVKAVEELVLARWPTYDPKPDN